MVASPPEMCTCCRLRKGILLWGQQVISLTFIPFGKHYGVCLFRLKLKLSCGGLANRYSQPKLIFLGEVWSLLIPAQYVMKMLRQFCIPFRNVNMRMRFGHTHQCPNYVQWLDQQHGVI
jgi:hypothetical protein